jgi:hypothetical protein
MHQDDRDAREAGSEYYFGPDLLVAPVLSPVTQRALYLPEGKWIDYWTGRSFDGKQTISVDAPLDRIPLFVVMRPVRSPTSKAAVCRMNRLEHHRVSSPRQRPLEICPSSHSHRERAEN